MGNVQLHASAARGFQGGGWNQFALVPGDARAIDAATAWTLRAGVRGAFFGDRLMIDLAGFRVTASAQPGMVGARDAAGVPMLALGNTAPMTNHGAELAATATPLPGLTLHANIGWQRARFAADAVILAQQASCLAQRAAGGVPLAPGSDDAPACGLGIVTPSGALARPAGTPALTADLGARWDVALPAAGITLTPLVNARYIGETWLEPAGTSLFGGAVRGRSGTLYPANTSAGPLLVGALAPAAWQVQAALQMRTIDGNWLLSLECENCLDTRWVQSQALGQPVLAPPRLWQLRLRRRF